jgi:hypothetical protein
MLRHDVCTSTWSSTWWPRDQVEVKARCLHFYLVLHLVAWSLKSRVS